MLIGTPVLVRYSPLTPWNGEQGRILGFFTMADGRRAAIIRLHRIALEVVFPVLELEKAD